MRLPTKIDGILNFVNASINSEYVKDEKNDMKTNIDPKILKNINNAKDSPSACILIVINIFI